MGKWEGKRRGNEEGLRSFIAGEERASYLGGQMCAS